MLKKIFLIIVCAVLLLTACTDANEATSLESGDISSESLNETESSNEPSEPDESESSQAVVINDPFYNGVAQLYITTDESIQKSDYVSCTLKLVDKSGAFEEIYDENGRVKIRGNSTSVGEKKPYNIKFSSSQRPIGLGSGKKFCLLANLYDKTLMRNRLSYDFAAAVGGCHYTPDTEYVDVFLNNRYLGNYLMTEAVGEGKDRVDIDIKKNEFLFEYEPWDGYSNPVCIHTPYLNIILGFNDPEEPTEEQLEWLEGFLLDAEGALLTHDIAEIEKYFDIASFVDFYVVNELFKDVDFSTSSTRFYLKGDKLYAGPLWDMDLSSGNVSNAKDYYDEYWNKSTSNDSTKGFFCRKIWYRELFKCNEFAELVKERYIELQPMIINLTTDNELGQNRIDALVEKYGKSFRANYSRAGWLISRVYGEFETRTPANTFSGNVEFLREWLIARNAWILSQFTD